MLTFLFSVGKSDLFLEKIVNPPCLGEEVGFNEFCCYLTTSDPAHQSICLFAIE